jgi:hypothetical protein
MIKNYCIYCFLYSSKTGCLRHSKGFITACTTLQRLLDDLERNGNEHTAINVWYGLCSQQKRKTS